jgi:hypothetical protein
MRRAITAFLFLSLAACSKSGPPSSPTISTAQADAPAASTPDGYRLSGPYTHGNQNIYLVHSANAPQDDLGCITLEEALKSGAIKVTERPGAPK